ncbi:hypothetical protein B4U80_11902, partial [Leptotrombidium deliense]
MNPSVSTGNTIIPPNANIIPPSPVAGIGQFDTHIITPKTFSGAAHENVAIWLEDYEVVAAANSWSEATKLKKLPAFLSGTARSHYQLEIAAQQLTWADIKANFLKQFLPHDHKRLIKEELNSRKQLPNEPVANFICEMRGLAKRVDPNMPEDELVSLIMNGILPSISQQLFSHNIDKVETLQTKAVQTEWGLRKAQRNTSTLLQPKNITAISSDLQTEIANLKTQVENMKMLSEVAVGAINDRAPRTRTEDGRPICFTCRRVGHVSAFCPNKSFQQQQPNFRSRPFNRPFQSRPPVQSRSGFNRPYFQQQNLRTRRNWSNNNRGNQTQFNRSSTNFQYRNRWNSRRDNEEANRQTSDRNSVPISSIEMAAISEVDATRMCANKFKREILVKAKINDIEANCNIDSGSVISAINSRFAKQINSELFEYTGPAVRVANGNRLYPLGEVRVNMSVTLNEITKSAVVKIAVVDNLTFDVLIGNDLNTLFGFVIDYSKEEVSFNNTEINDNYLRSTKTVVIPKYSTAFVPVSYKSNQKRNSFISFVNAIADNNE